MVAYSFQKQFVEPIQKGVKTQTIRAHRRRHARPGEPMQLFCGMRTKHCKKIIDDPICRGLESIEIDLTPLDGCTTRYEDRWRFYERLPDVGLSIDGARLDENFQRQYLAEADGFEGLVWTKNDERLLPFTAMMLFWLATHGPQRFEGLIIHWNDLLRGPSCAL